MTKLDGVGFIFILEMGHSISLGQLLINKTEWGKQNKIEKKELVSYFWEL